MKSKYLLFIIFFWNKCVTDPLLWFSVIFRDKHNYKQEVFCRSWLKIVDLSNIMV